MMLTEINQQLFLLLNAAPDASQLTISIALFCAQYLIYAPLIIGGFYWLTKPLAREIINRLVVTVAVTLLVAIMLRSVITSARPFELLIGTNFLAHSTSNSFPSKHAAVIFAITFGLLYIARGQLSFKKWFIGSLLIAGLISWARVYLGVHWPFDILAAALLSWICAYLIDIYWHHFKACTRFVQAKSGVLFLDQQHKRKNHQIANKKL